MTDMHLNDKIVQAIGLLLSIGIGKIAMDWLKKGLVMLKMPVGKVSIRLLCLPVVYGCLALYAACTPATFDWTGADTILESVVTALAAMGWHDVHSDVQGVDVSAPPKP